MTTPLPLLLWDIIERHLDEAEFLWEVWERSLIAPNYALENVAEESEERLLAHIDGLVANGPEVARRILLPVLQRGEPPRVSAAALSLVQSPGELGTEAVLTALRTRPEQRGPITRALACADRPELLRRMRTLLGTPDQSVVAAAAEVLMFHYQPVGEVLATLLESDSPAVRALGLRAVPSEAEPPLHLGAVHTALTENDPLIVEVALETGCRLGLEAAWRCVQDRAAGTDKVAMLLFALGGGPANYVALISALGDVARRPAALWALGFVGTPEAVDASLEWLEDKQTGHLAGEVFTTVTGVDLEDVTLKAPPEENQALDFTPEDALPRLDPEKVRQWWTRHRAGFVTGHRYLMGKPRSLPGLVTALVHGPMRRRPALLLDLQLHAGVRSAPRLQTRALTRRQYAELSAMDSLVSTGMDVNHSLF